MLDLFHGSVHPWECVVLAIVTDIMCPCGECQELGRTMEMGWKDLPSIIDMIANASFLLTFPFPTMVRDFQAVISKEIREEILVVILKKIKKISINDLFLIP